MEMFIVKIQIRCHLGNALKVTNKNKKEPSVRVRKYPITF